MRVSKMSPAFTATMGPSAPESTRWPARSGCPTAAIVRASQTTALSGLPRHAAPAPDGHRFTAPRHHHAAQPEVDVGQPFRRAAKHVGAGRRIVRHGVDEADVPARDTAADDLERGQQVIDRLDDVGVSGLLHVQVAPENEGHLGLDLRLLQALPSKPARHRRSPCRRTACRSRAGRRRVAPAPPSPSGRSCSRRCAGLPRAHDARCSCAGSHRRPPPSSAGRSRAAER